MYVIHGRKNKLNLDTERVQAELRKILKHKRIELRNSLWGHSNTFWATPILFEQHSEKGAKWNYDANSKINHVCHT